MKLRITHIFHTLILVSMLFACVPNADAQSQSLSVTPPLFQLSVSPGNTWQSSIKVVNSNPYPITIYAEVVNFVATGEAGQGRFLPIEGDTADKKTLAEWIEIAKVPHTIAAEQSKDISFLIDVPENAPPGGHYAAILVSTQPAASEGAASVQTVQSVTSLFFLRIEGDVGEIGMVREFRALDAFVGVPDVTLSLRFENKGNVHLQPKGDIIITNMWGTERGRIPVNYRSNFGNVLPESIRDFTFSWRTDFKITDIGRYKALATLAYGVDGVKSVDAAAYFWVIPVKATIITLLVLGVFITLITLMVRAYIRRVLSLAGVDMGQRETVLAAPDHGHREKIRTTYQRAAAPITHGVLDLRARLRDMPIQKTRTAVVIDFIVQYRVFFLSVVALTAIVASLWWYVRSATDDDQMYEVRVIEDGMSAPVITE
jgi:hypothetical protein